MEARKLSKSDIMKNDNMLLNFFYLLYCFCKLQKIYFQKIRI